MKKRFFVICTMLVFVFCGTLLLSACGGTKNAEFEQFKEVIETVLQVMDSKTGETVATSNKDTLRMITPTSTIHSLVLADELKTTPDSVDYYFTDAKDQAFFGPLLCGEVLTNKKKVKTFYGIKSYMEYFGQYIMVENSGTHYICNVYADENSGFEEEYYVYLDLDYKAQNNFEFVNIGFNNDYSKVNYIYGNNKGEMYFVIKSAEDNRVVTSYQGQMYDSTDSTVIDSAYALVKDEIESISKDKQRSVKAGCQYTITEAEYMEVAEDYFGDMGSQETIGNEFGYMIEDNCLMFFTGMQDQMPAAITLPSNIDSIYWQALILAPQVTELTIPSNVKYIKARVADLMDNPPAMINPGDPEYQLQTLTAEQIMQKFMLEAQGLTKIVANDSTLFDTTGGNFYLKANNALLKLLDATTITHLNLSESALTEDVKKEVIYNGIEFPNLVSTYEKLTKEYSGAGVSIESNTAEFFMRSQSANYELDSVTIEGINGAIYENGSITSGPNFGLVLNGVKSIDNLVIKGFAHTLQISGTCNITTIDIYNPYEVVSLTSLYVSADIEIKFHFSGVEIAVDEPTMLGDYQVKITYLS